LQVADFTRSAGASGRCSRLRTPALAALLPEGNVCRVRVL
jgi:hypothetical protein